MKGRPTKFREEDIKLIMYMYRQGKIDDEVAKELKVTKQTINNWKKSNKDFFDSLKENKDVANQNVVKSLYERAMGFETIETHIENFVIKGKGNNPDMPAQKIKTITKKVVQDTTAIIFWLNNRMPDKWMNRKYLDIGLNADTSDIIERINKVTEDHKKSINDKRIEH